MKTKTTNLIASCAKPLNTILIIATIAFSSCNTEKKNEELKIPSIYAKTFKSELSSNSVAFEQKYFSKPTSISYLLIVGCNDINGSKVLFATPIDTTDFTVAFDAVKSPYTFLCGESSWFYTKEDPNSFSSLNAIALKIIDSTQLSTEAFSKTVCNQVIKATGILTNNEFRLDGQIKVTGALHSYMLDNCLIEVDKNFFTRFEKQHKVLEDKKSSENKEYYYDKYLNDLTQEVNMIKSILLRGSSEGNEGIELFVNEGSITMIDSTHYEGEIGNIRINNLTDVSDIAKIKFELDPQKVELKTEFNYNKDGLQINAKRIDSWDTQFGNWTRKGYDLSGSYTFKNKKTDF